MTKIPTIEVYLEKKCKQCGKGGATQNGFCLKCITKNLKAGKYDHILHKRKTDSAGAGGDD